EFIKQINRISSRLGYYTTIYTEKSKVSKKIPNIKLKYIYNLTFTRINDIKTFFNEIPCFGPKAKNSKDLVNKFKQHHIKKSKNTKFISWRKIKSIKKITFTEPTYNLTIEGDHNFIVGNIITHNCGRAGHQLHGVVKGRVIVLDRDDLIECSLLLKSAIEKKIDRVQIPRNALDVLAQQIYGIAINGVINIYELFHLIKGSYCYHELTWDDFFELIKFLSGHYVSLEERHVYARIWYDQDTGDIGKKGKLARVIYMTNIGTIPEQTHVKVKIGEQIVGSIDEGFLERMRPGDVFVLGGNVYMFRFARGMTAQVSTSVNRPPTVPSWFSEMLPLSFDLAMEINRFRRLMDERFHAKESKKDIIKFIDDYLYVNEKAAESIYQYFYEQFHFSYIPHDKKIVVESYTDRGRTYVIFQTLFGRRVNDCLSRSLAFVIGRSQHRDVEVGISDNGFYLSAEKTFNPMRAFELLKTQDFRGVLEESIDKSEVLSRRFRHCAGRSLMILRSYMGRKKSVGRAHMGSKILFNAVKRIDPNFSILKEARREVLEDQMDIIHAQQIIDSVINGPAIIVEKNTKMPSPFAFGLIMAGYSDVIKVEDKQEFLKRMHQQVLARIALKHGKKLVKEKMEEFSYQKYWEEAKKESDDKKDMFKEKLKMQVWSLKKVPVYAKEQLIKLIDNGNLNARVTKELKEHKKEIKKEWPQGLREFLLERI
ncbi:hypothetical protein HN799_04745, partial [Candidatus Woesearchaeota archaeon]|nr:hypothetical protein [Candidatus Woesearchaeota archaeon]